MAEHETRTCDYCGAEMDYHGPPINSYACPENAKCNWMRAADLEESGLSSEEESPPVLQWRDDPPTEPGAYWFRASFHTAEPVRVRDSPEGLVAETAGGDCNLEDEVNQPWLESAEWAGPIPEPREPDEVESMG